MHDSLVQNLKAKTDGCLFQKDFVGKFPNASWVG